MKHKKTLFLFLVILTVSFITHVMSLKERNDLTEKNKEIYSLFVHEKGPSQTIEVSDEKMIAKKFRLLAELSFLEGIEALQSNQKNDAMLLFETAIREEVAITDKRIILTSYLLLIRENIASGNEKKVLRIAHDAMGHLTTDEYERFAEETWGILATIAHLPNGRNLIIQELEHILNKQQISDKTMLFFLEKLGGIYIENFNYAKAIQTLTHATILANKLEDSTYLVHCLADMAMLFERIQLYEKTDVLISKINNLLVKGEIEDVQVKIHVLLQLAVIAFERENSVLAQKFIEEIKRELNSHATSIESEYEIMYELLCAQLKITRGFEAQGNEMLLELENKAGTELKENADIKIYYLFLKAYILQMQKKYDQALRVYSQLLDESRQGETITLVHLTLTKLIEISDETNDDNLKVEIEKQIAYMKDEILKGYIKDYGMFAIGEYNYFIKKMRESEKELLHKQLAITILFVLLMICVYAIFRIKYFRKLSLYDELTGLYNRRFFNYQMSRKLSEKTSYYLLIIDIDNFKLLNDTYGHLFGDEVLKKIAQLFHIETTGVGEVYRYGGEEIAIIYREKDSKQVIRLGNSIRKKVSHMEWENGHIVTISIGISKIEGTVEETIENADAQLYLAKMSGKNCVAMKNKAGV